MTRAGNEQRFEFLWHGLLSASLKKLSEAPRNDLRHPRKDSSAEESKTKESHSEEKKTDLDCLPLNRKNRDHRQASVCRRFAIRTRRFEKVSRGTCKCR